MSKKHKRPANGKQPAEPATTSPRDALPVDPPKKNKALLAVAIVLVVAWIGALASLAWLSRFGG